MAPKLHHSTSRRTRLRAKAAELFNKPPDNSRNNIYKIQEEDVIYLILGQTGAGKSSFINYALSDEAASVGHGLNSHTTDIQPFLLVEESGRRTVLVDTPGFNDTWASDQAIMRRIVEWLSSSCQPHQRFGGIIYLHEISQARNVPETNTMHPTRLSKPDAPKYVILTTVKWTEVNESLGHLRETQLKHIWGTMSERGSRMARFADSTESARAIINLFPAEPKTVGDILSELRRILVMLPAADLNPKVRGEGLISRIFGKIARRG